MTERGNTEEKIFEQDFFYFRARDLERTVSRALRNFDRAEVLAALEEDDMLRMLAEGEPGI